MDGSCFYKKQCTHYIKLLNPEDDFHTVGFNHETCPLNFREMIAIGENDLEMALKSLQGVDGIYESVILSTCNRTEIYLAPELAR